MEIMDSEELNKGQSRQQRRFGKTRNKILSAARSVFSEKGLASATIEDIVERADVGHGTFYYHFATKDDLIKQLIVIILKQLTKEVRAKSRDKKELGELLDSMIGAHITFFSARWEDFVLYYHGGADMTLLYSYEGLETPFIDYLKSIEKLVDRAVPQPISGPKLRGLACAIAGFIAGYYSFASITSGEEDIDAAFMSLRNAFVTSLVRFINTALPAK